MGWKAIYICDLCKKQHEQTEEERGNIIPMKKVSINVEPIYNYAAFNAKTRYQSAVWCDQCISERNVTNLLLRAEVPEKKVTLEDLVREIVQESNS